MTYLVVAGTYEEFAAWCRMNSFQLLYGQPRATRPGEAARYITNEDQANGLVNSKVVVVGSWHRNSPLRNSAWLKARSHYV